MLYIVQSPQSRRSQKSCEGEASQCWTCHVSFEVKTHPNPSGVTMKLKQLVSSLPSYFERLHVAFTVCQCEMTCGGGALSVGRLRESGDVLLRTRTAAGSP